MTTRVVVERVSVIPGALYTMAVAAELCGLHPQTLRVYERHGLVSPARTAGGTRRYSSHDIELARRINGLSSMRMSLEAIALVLALEAENVQLRAEVARLRNNSSPGPEPEPDRAET